MHQNNGTDFMIRQGRFLVKLAAVPREREDAFRLRLEVFNLELKEGLAMSYFTCMDRDAYDDYRDRLIEP
jgi:putative hemolysin